jgi:O-antigen/teichoic acid export membrane protein
MAIVNIGLVVHRVFSVINSVVIGVAVARHLGPIEFYELAKVTSIFMLATALLRFGYEYRVLATFKNKPKLTYIALNKALLIIMFMLSTIALGVIYISGPSLWAFGFSALPCAMIPVLDTTFAVNKRSNISATLGILITILFAVTRLVSIEKGFDINVFLSIFLAEIVVSCYFMVPLLFLLNKGKQLLVVSMPNISELFWPATITILSLFTLKLPLFLSEYILEESQLGSFALSLRVFESIIIVIAAATTSRFYKYTKIFDLMPEPGVLREGRVISLALLFVCVGFLVLPNSIYLLVVGQQYELAITNIKILLFIMPLYFFWNMADKVLLTISIQLVALRQAVLALVIATLYIIMGLFFDASGSFLCVLIMAAYIFSYVLLDYLVPRLKPLRVFKLALFLR